MPPRIDILNQEKFHRYGEEVLNYSEKEEERKHTIIWFNVITACIMHVIVIYGIFLTVTSVHMLTTLQVVVLHYIGVFGVTGGLHRLWSHRAYKANFPLRTLLMLCATLSFQGTIYQWVRDHRVHHKCSDTHADPHNPSNGFFFAHIGWLLCKKFPEVREKGKQIDFQDVLSDPIVKFQKKHIRSLVILLAVIIPTSIPMVLWGESLTNAFCLNFLRYFITLHSMFAVNSVAHAFGGKPYDRNIRPTENSIISIFASGEGFHNYHHTFPWDYKAAELGNYSLNYTTALIDLFAKIGWAYDLKTTSEEMVKKRCSRTGDGSHEIWGWGDKDQPRQHFEEAIIMYKRHLNNN